MSLRPKKPKWQPYSGHRPMSQEQQAPDKQALESYQKRTLKIAEVNARASEKALEAEKERGKNLRHRSKVEKRQLRSLADVQQEQRAKVPDAKDDDHKSPYSGKSSDGRFVPYPDTRRTYLTQKKVMGLASQKDLGELSMLESSWAQPPEGE